MLRTLSRERSRSLSNSLISGRTILRFGISGAVTSALMVTGFWIASQLPYGPTDWMIGAFTYAPPATTRALFEAVLNAAVAGFFTAAIFGIAFYALRFTERL